MSVSDTNPIRLLVCAPDLLTRVGLAALLQTYPDLMVVGQVAPTDDLANAATIYQAELIVWDVGWATDEATEVVTTVVDECPPILALVATTDALLSLWRAGVRGVLLHDRAPAALVAAMHALFHGLTVLDPATPQPTAAAGASMAGETYYEPLTEREIEVLQALAQGLSNKLIARHLAISEHTVKFHVNAILGKLGAASRTDAVVRATRAGLIQL